MCGAEGGLLGQLLSDFPWQAQLHAGGGHGFDQQEEIRRATAGHGRDGVQLLLFFQPQGYTHGRQQLLGLLTLGGAHLGGGVQAADTLAQQRWGVGHAAHDGLGAEPVVHAGAVDTGGNRHHQLLRRQAWAQGFAHGFHGLWLDRNDNHVGVLDGLRVIGKQFDAMLGGHFGPRLGTRIAGADMCCIQTFADNAEAIHGVDVIVLAVKPQAMKAVCESLRPSLQPHQLVVSIAAGITCASMTNWLGAQPIVRCMPNTPALLRQGVSGLYATGEVTAQQRDQAQELLSAVGIAVWLEQEQQLDAVTAVSGSGPAYFFLLIEAMTAAGVKLGLPHDVAEQLAEQTALGAAKMAVGSEVDAAELRRRVTSPGGTTQAAIESFQAGGFEALVETALGAAAHRSAEMAEQLGK